MCLFLLIVGTGTIIGTVNGADDLAQKCSQVVEKVIPCLNFATGKAPTPSKECCDATTAIKESNPECLCYIIQQTHKGSPESKRMGIQEAKLLQLPSACNVKNASITDCPSKSSCFKLKLLINILFPLCTTLDLLNFELRFTCL